jgi:D-alanine-D-alanine ligase
MILNGRSFLKTILLAADIYENGLSESNQEWESEESILILRDELTALGYDAILLEDAAEIVHFIIDYVTRKNKNELIVFNLIEGYQSRNREAYIPAVCEYLGICYTGSDAYGQVIALDKYLFKIMISQMGILTPKSKLLTKESSENHEVSFPLFVKPNGEGSSLGIGNQNILQSHEQYTQITNQLFQKFDELLLEEYIAGVDVTIGLFGFPGNYIITEPGRVEIAGEVYSETIKSKYAMPETVVFDLAKDLEEEAKNICLKIANRFKIAGPARFDFRLDKGKLYLLELNLTPGLSKIYSTLPKLWHQTGAGYYAMIQNIISSAEWRYQNNISFGYGKRKHSNG